MDYREELLRTPQILERVMEEKQEAGADPRPASGLLRLRDLLLSLRQMEAFAAFREDGRWR